MPEIQSGINVANDVSIDIANDVLPVWWMEVYHLRFNQSKSVYYAGIK